MKNILLLFTCTSICNFSISYYKAKILLLQLFGVVLFVAVCDFLAFCCLDVFFNTLRA